MPLRPIGPRRSGLQIGAGAEPSNLPIRTDDAVVGLDGLALGDRPAQRAAAQPRPVIRVHQGDVAGQGPVELDRLEAVDPVELLGPLNGRAVAQSSTQPPT